MKVVLSALLPLVWGQQAAYSSAYPQPVKPTPYSGPKPTPYSSSYSYNPNPTPRPPSPQAYQSSYPESPPPSFEYVPPSPAYKAKARGKKGKQYVVPTPRVYNAYATPPTPAPTNYVPPPTPYPTPLPTNYVPPPTNYVPPPTNYVPPPTNYVPPPTNYAPPPTEAYVAPTSPPSAAAYTYVAAAIPPVSAKYSSSDSYTQAYPIPELPKSHQQATTKYTSAYELPEYFYEPQYVPPTPAPTIYKAPVDNSLMCTESAVGCYQGHLRLCVPGQRQDNARIVRRCEKGCMRCASGVPDSCVNDKYSQDICQTLALSHRQGRSCTAAQEGQVGCLGGPDIGYCIAGTVIVIDYCGSVGCVGNPVNDQCWPLVRTSAPSVAVTLPPVRPENMCDGNYIFCWQGHIRLCLDKQPKDSSAVLQDCRSQGCSVCSSGPDMCNDPDGSNVCSLVSPERQLSVCSSDRAMTTYCDGFDVRHCDATGRGIMVEFCGTRGCSDRPPMCNAAITNDDALCVGTYVLCHQGHVRLCRDGQPMGQSQVLQNCRAQGCSNCPDAPAICNDDNRQSLCGKVPADAFVKPCDVGVSPMTTYCAANDVRHCDPSGRAFLVEYCGARGCQTNPLGCTPRPPGPTTPPTVGSGNNNNNNNGGGKTCGPRVRREWGALPDADRTLFINALQELYRKGECQRLAQFHFNYRDAIHGTNNIHFFIWHRVLLFELEEALRSLPGFECVTVPYWNYQYSNSAQARQDRRSPFGVGPTKLGQGDNADCIGGSFAFVRHSLDSPDPHCIRRAPTDLQSSLSCSLFMDLANVGEPAFVTFANNLQVAHGAPHISFGDTFSSHYSPVDPLFWLHHSNIDRTWDLWQDCHTDYWWYEEGALGARIEGYPGLTAGDFVDNANIKWKGRTYSLSYSSDDWQDPSLYSSDFRRNIATRCSDHRLRRYTSPNPILGVDDAWTKAAISNLPNTLMNLRFSLLPITQQQQTMDVQESSISLSCLSSGLDNEHGEILATYSDVSATECAYKCDKFFFKNTGANNCMCTSVGRRPTTRVLLNSSSPISRLAYFPGCEGADQNEYGYYELASLQGPNRRLLQKAQRLVTSARLTSLLRTPPPTAKANLRDLAVQLRLQPNLVSAVLQRDPVTSQPPAPVPEGDLCYEQQVTDKQSVPPSCSEDSPKFVLPKEWLEMNNIQLDEADPCAKYQRPVGFHGVQCVNV